MTTPIFIIYLISCFLFGISVSDITDSLSIKLFLIIAYPLISGAILIIASK